MDDIQARIDGFIDKFADETAALTRALLARMKTRLPGATIMVYDNYNALVFGFGATERPAQAVLSLAVYPDWINLFFIWGKGLPDPHRLLQGEGNQVRFVRLSDENVLDDPRVDALIAAAADRSEPPFDTTAEQRTVIRSVSAKQRPRR